MTYYLTILLFVLYLLIGIAYGQDQDSMSSSSNTYFCA